MPYSMKETAQKTKERSQLSAKKKRDVHHKQPKPTTSGIISARIRTTPSAPQPVSKEERQTTGHSTQAHKDYTTPTQGGDRHVPQTQMTRPTKDD